MPFSAADNHELVRVQKARQTTPGNFQCRHCHVVRNPVWHRVRDDLNLPGSKSGTQKLFTRGLLEVRIVLPGGVAFFEGVLYLGDMSLFVLLVFVC